MMEYEGNGAMEYRSIGVMFWNPTLQYSITPSILGLE